MKHYTTIADLFRYPGIGLKASVSHMKKIVATDYVICEDKIIRFEHFINNKSINQQREYYIKTFDVQAPCHLDIGSVLYGEDYKRGEFLVHIVNEQKNAANDCGQELADHLPNMLTLLPKMKDEELARELAYSIMIPALKEMVKNFKGDDNIYKGLLDLLLQVMEIDFHDLEYKQFILLSNDKEEFIKSCNPQKCKSHMSNKMPVEHI